METHHRGCLPALAEGGIANLRLAMGASSCAMPIVWAARLAAKNEEYWNANVCLLKLA